MYESLKDYLNSKSYDLKDILYKINIVWTKGYVSDEQMKELEELARNNAKAGNSYASLQEQINDIYNKFNTEMTDVKSRLNKLEGKEETTEPTEEYPEYKQPHGAYDAYNEGDKITYNGKKYICKANGCVYNPDEYPPYWEEVIEDKENNEESEVQE